MLKRILQWFVRLWFWLTGVKKQFLLDPLFFSPIDTRFRQKVVASPMWSSSTFAIQLLTKAGVCVHPSMTAGRLTLDPSISRTHVAEGYASMCIIAAGPPIYQHASGRWDALSWVSMASAPLPEGWSRISEQERLSYAALADEQYEIRWRQIILYGSQCNRQQITAQLVDCDPVDEECCICLDQGEKQWAFLRVCKHRFHVECITEITQLKCPLCRTAI